MGSAEEETTTETEVGEAPPAGVVAVGRVSGAVKVPFTSILPQVGSQLSDNGLAKVSRLFLDAVLGWTSLKTAVEGLVLSNEALKEAVWAGLIPTGTVAVNGVIETRIPESRPTCPVPVFFLSASAVAIKLRTGMGFGKLVSDGAV